MKITIGQLKQKEAILKKVDLSINDKLTYAVKRIYSRIEHATKGPLSSCTEAIADYTVCLASVDEKGNLVMLGDKYSFTPHARKELQQFVASTAREFDAEEVEIEPYQIEPLRPGFERAAVLFDEFDVEELTGILF